MADFSNILESLQQHPWLTVLGVVFLVAYYCLIRPVGHAVERYLIHKVDNIVQRPQQPKVVRHNNIQETGSDEPGVRYAVAKEDVKKQAMLFQRKSVESSIQTEKRDIETSTVLWRWMMKVIRISVNSFIVVVTGLIVTAMIIILDHMW